MYTNNGHKFASNSFSRVRMNMKFNNEWRILPELRIEFKTFPLPKGFDTKKVVANMLDGCSFQYIRLIRNAFSWRSDCILNYHPLHNDQIELRFPLQMMTTDKSIEHRRRAHMSQWFIFIILDTKGYSDYWI